MTGFEPATSRSQSARSTKLSYIPEQAPIYLSTSLRQNEIVPYSRLIPEVDAEEKLMLWSAAPLSASGPVITVYDDFGFAKSAVSYRVSCSDCTRNTAAEVCKILVNSMSLLEWFRSLH